MREERNTPGSEFGELIEDHIRNGTIVPVEITCSLLEKAMNRHVSERQAAGDVAFGPGRFLIDGFPRNQNNLDGWQKDMAEKVDFKFVLYFDCPDEVCVARCLKRGEAGSGRSDDNQSSLQKRMDTFRKDTLPIVNHYRNMSRVKSVDGTLDPESVYRNVQEIFSC